MPECPPGANPVPAVAIAFAVAIAAETLFGEVRLVLGGCKSVSTAGSAPAGAAGDELQSRIEYRSMARNVKHPTIHTPRTPRRAWRHFRC